MERFLILIRSVVMMLVIAPCGVAASDAQNSASNASAAVIAAPGPAQDTITKTAHMIAGYKQSRIRRVMTRQSTLPDHANSQRAGDFNLNATRGKGNFTFNNSGQKYWIDVNGSRLRLGTTSASYVFGAVGRDFAWGDSARVGAMAQFDWITQEAGDRRLEGAGYMVGPYATGAIKDTKLRYEARFLYGATSNKISPDGDCDDGFNTKRMMALARLEGSVTGGRFTFFPHADLSYLQDDMDGYTDDLNQAIPDQTLKMSQYTLGVDFARPIATERGNMTLTGGASYVQSSVKRDGAAMDQMTDNNDTRGQAQIGTSWNMDDRGTISAELGMYGIGAAAPVRATRLKIGYQLSF